MGITLALDTQANTVKAELDRLVVDLADAADLAGLLVQGPITAAGSLQGRGSATLGLDPFAVHALQFQADLKDTRIAAEGVALENAAENSGGKAPIAVRVNAEGKETISWRLEPLALSAPAQLRIDTLQGRFHVQDTSATLTARCRTTIPVQSVEIDGQPLTLLEPAAFEWMLSAAMDAQNTTTFDIKPADTSRKPTIVWQWNDIKGSQHLGNMFASGKKTADATTVTYGVLLNNTAVDATGAALAFPSINLDGRLEMANQIRGEAKIRLAKGTAQARDVAAKNLSVGLDVRLEQDIEKHWSAGGKAFADCGPGLGPQAGRCPSVDIRILAVSVAA